MKATQVEVLAWLQENLPELHANAEIERAWVWVPGNLSGNENKELREKLKGAGFKFKPKADHVLPSGKTARWAHSCDHPIPFHRKGGKSSGNPSSPSAKVDDLVDALDI